MAAKGKRQQQSSVRQSFEKLNEKELQTLRGTVNGSTGAPLNHLEGTHRETQTNAGSSKATS